MGLKEDKSQEMRGLRLRPKDFGRLGLLDVGGVCGSFRRNRYIDKSYHSTRTAPLEYGFHACSNESVSYSHASLFPPLYGGNDPGYMFAVRSPPSALRP